MNVAKVILSKLKKENKTKQWLASKINLSYSTLHQKLSNNTFTAEELITLCMLFQLDIQHFVERPTDGKMDIMETPISARPDVTIETMENYIRGGIGIESEHENGALLYLPYGIQSYLVHHYETLQSVVSSYRAASEIQKDICSKENDQTEYQLIENFLYELENISFILENTIHTLKEID